MRKLLFFRVRASFRASTYVLLLRKLKDALVLYAIASLMGLSGFLCLTCARAIRRCLVRSIPVSSGNAVAAFCVETMPPQGAHAQATRKPYMKQPFAQAARKLFYVSISQAG